MNRNKRFKIVGVRTVSRCFMSFESHGMELFFLHTFAWCKNSSTWEVRLSSRALINERILLQADVWTMLGFLDKVAIEGIRWMSKTLIDLDGWQHPSSVVCTPNIHSFFSFLPRQLNIYKKEFLFKGSKMFFVLHPDGIASNNLMLC